MIFYSLANLGFSPEKAQIDDDIWINALFDYYHKLASLSSLTQQDLTGNHSEQLLKSSLPTNSGQRIDSVQVFDPALQKEANKYASLKTTQADIFSAVTGFFPPILPEKPIH